MKTVIIISAILILCACTDAQRGNAFTIGQPASVTCYAPDGKPIYQGTATGAIGGANDQGSTWYFRDTDGHYVEVMGSCVAIYR